MGTPLKVSDALVAAARQEAKIAERSITAQVEHWAKIGKAVEEIVAHDDLLKLKMLGELLSPAVRPPIRGRQMHKLLSRLVADADRSTVISEVRKAGNPIYSSIPSQPGIVAQVLPDGRRVPGRIMGRRFVPTKPGVRDTD